MKAKDILIRTLSCIEQDKKYISKVQSLILGVPSTAEKVKESYQLSPQTDQKYIDAYSKVADDILQYIISYSGDSNYLQKCKNSVKIAEENPDKAYFLLTSLVVNYKRFLNENIGLEKVKKPNEFEAQRGEVLNSLMCEVINIIDYKKYFKILLLSPASRLLTYSLNKKTSSFIPKIGDNVIVTAKVHKNKFFRVFETVLCRPIIQRLNNQ